MPLIGYALPGDIGNIDSFIAGDFGYMLLNPCSFPRRAAVELEGYSNPVPTGGPVKASQLDGSVARLVVELPPLARSNSLPPCGGGRGGGCHARDAETVRAASPCRP